MLAVHDTHHASCPVTSEVLTHTHTHTLCWVSRDVKLEREDENCCWQNDTLLTQSQQTVKKAGYFNSVPKPFQQL